MPNWPLGVEGKWSAGFLPGLAFLSCAKAATQASTFPRSVLRHRAEASYGLKERSSRPHKLRSILNDVQLGEVRPLRQRPMTGDAIIKVLHHRRAAIYRALRRVGLHRLARLAPEFQAAAMFGRNQAVCCIRISGNSGGPSWASTALRRTSSIASEVLAVVCACLRRHRLTDDHALVMSNQHTGTAVAPLRLLIVQYRKTGNVAKRLMTDN